MRFGDDGLSKKSDLMSELLFPLNRTRSPADSSIA